MTTPSWVRKLGARRLLGIAAAIVVAVLLVAGVLRREGPQSVDLTPPGNESAPQAKRPQLIVTYRDTPPEMLGYSPGRHSGPLRYVIEEAAERIGYGITWKSASFADSVDQVVAGTIDIAPNARFKTAEREKTMRFSVSLGRVPSVINFLVRKDNAAVIDTIDDLKGHAVGYRRNVSYFTAFGDATHFKKVAYGDDKSMVKGFADRVVDVLVVNNKRGIERALAAGGVNVNSFRYVNFEVSEEADVYLLYSKVPARQAVYDRLDQALLQMKQQGVITDIYNSFDADPPDAPRPPPLPVL